MFLNLGPQSSVGAHGVFRIVLQLDGEEIVLDCVPDIGYHHRGAEKMGGAPVLAYVYPLPTDRIDYLGGVMNNLPYVLSVEKLAGIKVPDKVDVIRIMMAEFFRITSHLLFLRHATSKTSAPHERRSFIHVHRPHERAYDVIEAVTGFRMHSGLVPHRRRSPHDPAAGLGRLRCASSVDWMPKRLDEYQGARSSTTASCASRTKARDRRVQHRSGHRVGRHRPQPARHRTCNFDLRKARPYSGLRELQTSRCRPGTNGDIYDRMASMRLRGDPAESVRIIQQCLDHMPSGPYKADHPLDLPRRPRSAPSTTSRP